MSLLGLFGNEDLNPQEIISGLGEVEIDALFGELSALPSKARVNAIKKIANTAAITQNKGRGTSREEFLKRMQTLDPDITKNIAKGHMRLADVELYATKYVGGLQTVKMLTDDDYKVVGKNNISRGKLEKDNVMLLHSIILISGVGAGAVNPFDVDFGLIPALIRNGEFLFKANGSEMIPLSSNEAFNTENMTCRIGEFKLDNPVLIQTQKELSFEISWATAAVPNTWMRIIFKGTTAYKK